MRKQEYDDATVKLTHVIQSAIQAHITKFPQDEQRELIISLMGSLAIHVARIKTLAISREILDEVQFDSIFREIQGIHYGQTDDITSN
jgi:hypothetical protein